MAAAAGHISFLIFLLFLASSSLRTQARLPNLFRQTTHFTVATEDSVPKEGEEEEDKQHRFASTTASQNPNRDGGLFGYYDPEKNYREKSTKHYNADAYEQYDQDPLKSSPVDTNYNTQEEEEEDHDFQLYRDQAIAAKKPLPFTSASSNYHNYYGTGGGSSSSRYQDKETYDNRDKQYYHGVENGRYFYDDEINGNAVDGGSRGRAYAASQYNHNSNEMYQQQEEEEQGEPRDGFTP